MGGTSGPQTVETKRRRIAELARTVPGALTTLAHHVDEEWLREAYRRTRKDGAVGIDGVTATEYERDLEENLRDLLSRLRGVTYRAPAVRRVHIPKDEPGEMRALGIPTFEDKVAQRAVLMLLEPVYEESFLPCSYGFRPGRGAHEAVRDLRSELNGGRAATVLELDIRRCFDAIPHGELQGLLRERVNDGTVVRLIGRWLHAGVLDGGSVSYPDSGTPQGGVLSPLLMNAYLHTVLDEWFEREVLPRLGGAARLIRYADDAVIVFERRDDAERVHRVLPKRFARFGLTLHPEKTRLVDFARPKDGRGPGTFSFLGFTFFWARSRRGTMVVKPKTASRRLSRAKKRVGAWLKTHRHLPVAVQHAALCRKLRGHYAYYGVSFNGRSLQSYHYAVFTLWRKWLSRRSQRGRLSMERYLSVLTRHPLPAPRIVVPLF